MQRSLRIRHAAALLAIAISGVFIAAAPAAAGKPSGSSGGKTSGTSTLELVALDSDDGVPHWGQRITFEVSSTATTQPQVDVNCYQDGQRVYVMWTGYYDSYPWPWTQVMTLQSDAWTGGAADCVARLYYQSGRKTVTGATTSFHVEA
jgi:hypothetical protein